MVTMIVHWFGSFNQFKRDYNTLVAHCETDESLMMRGRYSAHINQYDGTVS